jgi:Family of unknown function (DUF5361)
VGQALRYHAGGIAGLLTLERAQWEALESDLLGAGFVLADIPHRVTWRAVLMALQHSRRESAVARVVGGQRVSWGANEHLLAVAVDLLQVLVWMQSTDGQKNRNRPKPLPRPGVEPVGDRRFGDAQMTVDEAKAWLDTRRAGTGMRLSEAVI